MKIINKKTLRKTYINLILNMYKQEVMNMGQKGLDFKHKEVVNIKDGRRLRVCARCNSRFRKWDDYFYYCATEATNYLVCFQEIMIL